MLQVKPRPWAWHRGGLTPIGRQMSHGLLAAFPFWERSGSNTYDVVGRRAGAITTATWDRTGPGGLDFPGTNGQQVQFTGLYGEPNAVSIVVIAEVDSADTNGGELLSLGNNALLRVHTSGFLRGLYSRSGGFSSTTGTTDIRGIGQAVLVYSLDPDQARADIYVNGRLETPETDANAILWDQEANTFFGRHPTSLDFDVSARVHAAYIYGRRLDKWEVRQFSLDHYVVLRPDPAVGALLPIAPPATFPVTSAYMYKKITDVSAEPTTWDFVLAGGAAPQGAVAAAFSNVSGTHLDSSGTTTTGTNDMTPDSPDITTVNDGAMIVTMHGYGHDDTAPTAGAPSGYTSVALAQGGSGNRGGAAMAYKAKATAGADVIGSWTHSPDNATAEWHARTIALAPITAVAISEGIGIDDVTTSLSLDTYDVLFDHADLFRSLSSPATDGFVLLNNITPTEGDIVVDVNAGPDTEYFYILRAWEDSGETTFSDSNQIFIRTAPARPTDLAEVAVGDGHIDITWTDNTNIGTGPHKHRVYYRQQGDPGWILATPTGVAAGINVYRIQNLEFATTYEWTVTAWNPSA